MRALRTAGLVMATALAVAFATAVPSEAAVAPFGAAVRVTPTPCTGSRVVTAAGITYGACLQVSTTAAGRAVYTLRLFKGSGTSWTVQAGIPGSPVAVADDGAATYVLYNTATDARVLRWPRTGAVTSERAGDFVDPDATLVASGGKWWAVWSLIDPAIAGYRLQQSRTMGTPVTAVDTGLIGREPTLTLTSTASVALAWAFGGAPEGGVIHYGTSAGGAFTDAAVTSPSPLFAGNGVFGIAPRLVYDGGVTRLAWYRFTDVGIYNVAYLQRTTGSWDNPRLMSAALTNGWRGSLRDYDLARPPSIQRIGSTVSVAFLAGTSPTNATAIAQRDATGWSERALTTSTASLAPVGLGVNAAGKLVVTSDWFGAGGPGDVFTVQKTQS